MSYAHNEFCYYWLFFILFLKNLKMKLDERWRIVQVFFEKDLFFRKNKFGILHEHALKEGNTFNLK